MKLANNLFDSINPQIISDVGGGVKLYLTSFFPEKGIHQLNENNDQFLDLLQLFITLDKFYNTSQLGIDQIKEFLDTFDIFMEAEDAPEEITEAYFAEEMKVRTP